jgi:hypothetical protein
MFKQEFKVHSSVHTICDGGTKEGLGVAEVERNGTLLWASLWHNKKKPELKTFKAGRENIFGGICRTKPTDRKESSLARGNE